MRKGMVAIGLLAILGMALASAFVLNGEQALLAHPKGLIAREELHLIGNLSLLMLIIVIPTYILLYFTAWRYRKGKNSAYQPDRNHGIFGELILWIIPSCIIAVMACITWKAAHRLDPYKPLVTGVKPLKIEVLALDWKWLFIYPEEGIATLNFVQFPENTPIAFSLAADGSPMNSFWIPELSGQIYVMTGMITPLHLIADGVGEYRGRAAEINGRGFADMTFLAKSTSLLDFEKWVAEVKEGPLPLSDQAYQELVQPSEKMPIRFYSRVEEGLFFNAVMKNMHCH